MALTLGGTTNHTFQVPYVDIANNSSNNNVIGNSTSFSSIVASDVVYNSTWDPVRQGSGDLFRNATSPISNRTSTEDLYYVPTGLVVLLSVLYGSISVITVVGNTLVIVVIIKNKSMQTVTNFYIANLAVADVMIGVLSIPFQFQAALIQRWDLPYIMCPVAPFVKELTVNVSICTLAVISIDRFFAVIHPLKPRCSRRVAKIVMTLVWIFSLGSAAPTAIVFKVNMVPDGNTGRQKPFCLPTYPKAGLNLGKLYRLYLAVVQYFFPLLVISYAYFRIMYRIWGSHAPGSNISSRDQMLNRNKRKVIKMLIIVVVLFVFCWLPLQTYNLLSEITREINDYRYINIIWFSSNWLAMSNSCYNPFIYGLLNEKYKHAFRVLFSKCPCRCVRKPKFKEPFTDHSEESIIRKSSTSNEDTKIQVNGGRLKKYTRVRGFETESSFV